MTSLSEPFIRRPVMTLLMTVTIILFGIVCLKRMPVNDLPAVDYPVIQVTVSYPGASPETMAASVATPLERQFMQIAGLDLVTSTSFQGSTSMTLQFALDKRVEDAATDVQAAINKAGGNLPLDLPSPPIFSKFNPNDQPIFYIALSSDSLTEGQLYDYANTEVAQRISILSGVSRVDIFGSKRAIRVRADPSLLAARGLTLDDLAAAIRRGTSYQGAGQFDGRSRTFLLQTEGQLQTPEAFGQLVIAEKDGAPLYLKDVARVEQGSSDERAIRNFWSRSIGQPPATIVLAVSRQPGANAVETAGRVRALVPEFRTQLPGSISILPFFDRSQTIVRSVADVRDTLVIAFVLVILVIFVFLGRASDTIIPVVALPLSMLMTFVAMYALGYSIDNLSLLALTLAIGFLVDDAIVFLENTVRRMEAGESALHATIHGSREISFTILAMTLSLAAVFIPLLFMPGLIGRMFQQFAVTIIISIIASGVVSLTLTPLMCARMLTKHQAGKKTVMERTFGSVLRAVVGLYGRTLHFFLRHRWISWTAWVLSLAGTFWLLKAVPKSFLPVGDTGFIRGLFMAEEGASPDQMQRYQKQVDVLLHANPNLETSFTISGLSGRFASSQALVIGFLKPHGQRPPIQAVIGQLMGQMAKIPGIAPFLQAMPVLQISTGATANTQGKFSYAVSGIDADEVYAAADKLIAALRPYPGFFFVNSNLQRGTPNLRIEILRDQASSYGVSAQKILDTIRSAYAQNYVYLIKEPGDQYQVIVETEKTYRSRPDDLGSLYVRSDDGQRVVPISALARWTQETGPQTVNHINQFPGVTIFFNLKPGVAVSDATRFVEKTAAEVLPSTVTGSLQGEAQVFKETIATLAVLMLFAVFVMYVVLGVLYESFIHPVTVLSSLPVATVGGLAALLLFREEATLYAYVGLFLLIGIVKKNGIMMIDFALQRMREGMDSVTAVHEASMERFRPIMMTTAAAFMGAVPLALGYGTDGASRRPLGLVIVGGLLVSQLITLYVTPVVFLSMEWVQHHVLDRVPLLRSHGAHAGKEAEEEAIS